MAHSQHSPSFFIILIDHSAPHVEIPRDFVKKHLKNKIPKDPIIRSANGGYYWNLKIKKIGEKYCFTHGWNNVVKDINLGFGDFLFFKMVDKSTFKMFVFGVNACEKILPPKIIVEVDHVSEDVVVLDDDNEDDKDDDEDEEDDEDEDDDMDGDPLFTTVITTTSIYVLRLPRKFVKLVGLDDKRTTLMLKNRDGNEWKLGLRLDKVAKGRYCLSSGWQKFSRIHNLSKGDECVFKFIKNEDKLCLVTVNGENRSSDETVVKRGSGRGRPPKY